MFGPVILLLVIAVMAYFFLPRQMVLSRWNQYFDGLQFSAQEFYSEVELNIETRKLPNVSCSRVSHPERNFLLSQREYLKINCQELVIEVCASHFGTGSFVSWWLSKSVSYVEMKSAESSSKFATLVQATFDKTKYQLDKAEAFKSCINLVVKDAIEKVSTAKGYRSNLVYEKESVLPFSQFS